MKQIFIKKKSNLKENNERTIPKRFQIQNVARVRVLRYIRNKIGFFCLLFLFLLLFFFLGLNTEFNQIIYK